MKKTNRTVLIMAEIAVLAAFALGLDYISQIATGFLFPAGGSISLALIPVIIMSFRRGIIAGVATGLIIGTIQFSYGGWFINFLQFILDYPLPYALVGLASIFTYLNKRKINVITLISGILLGGFLKYFSHFLSGIIYWKASGGDLFGHAYKGFTYITWSIYYNGAYMVPTIIVTVILTFILYRYNKQFFDINN